MAASGFTPIQLYYSATSTTVPLAGNLVYGELAINITDGKLYFKNSSNVVTKIADVATATGSVAGGTAGAIVYQSAPNTSTFLNIGSNGFLVTASGGVPVYTNPSSITVGTATTATNISGGSANQLAYQSGAGATAFAPTPTTAGFVLGWTGSAFSWVSAPASTSATNLSGGTAGDLPFQSAVGTTGFISDTATGNALISGGVGVAPTYGKIGLTTHVSGTLPLANGGTGQTTATAAFNALAPSQTGNEDKYLKTDGTNTSWAPVVSQSDVNQTSIAFSLIFGG
jgi:hypothetical protein